MLNNNDNENDNDDNNDNSKLRCRFFYSDFKNKAGPIKNFINNFPPFRHVPEKFK